MYATCLFCNNALGTNEVLEYFPVGRRLAFDASKGRLWVICAECKRWNLSPLETRWEAIEEAKRAFRETKLRMATDNIGLARLREGLELVRVGAPERPEFAAWRYGNQFGGRYKKAVALTYGAIGISLGMSATNFTSRALGLGAVALTPPQCSSSRHCHLLPPVTMDCGRQSTCHRLLFATTTALSFISRARTLSKPPFLQRETGWIGSSLFRMSTNAGLLGGLA